MSDAITAKAGDSKFKAHPAGQFVGQCVDTINLGEAVSDYPGQEKYVIQKCALVFRTGERNEEVGEFIDVAAEFTVSMGDKANLRKFLEQWRGKPYEPHEVSAGVPLDKLTGNHGLLTVAHRKSGKGRTYANITACVGIPSQMRSSVTKYTDYTRADYWEDKKKQNREAVAKLRAEADNEPSSPASDNFDDFPNDDDGLADLPF